MEKISRKNIWNFKQNKPTLVVEDICKEYPNVDPDFVYNVLLKRGVFKWLSVRRDLIKLKNEWKRIVVILNRKKNREEKGFLKAVEMCRKSVRKLCHSDRLAAPDFDRKANKFLYKILSR